ncbi:PAS domain-containing sensor histidine kinase [Paraflavitalea soli]|uniref:histidine kinase n=1 Tax=Paraflavitalea soli TaxID=2315862 RepID=A0A3B7MMK9_9BACT|nr:PAS domain-containing sensor histidine kinase [Paraflavitalea soli]AXY74176.1 PAS domain-containing sensor histidine kinase [Paraflavitalea soli]
MEAIQIPSALNIDEKHLVEALFVHASIGIIVANENGDIILANPFLLELFDYQPSELLGKKIETLIPTRFHDRHVGHRQKFIDHLQNRPMGAGMDLFGLRKDGAEFPVEVSLCHYSNKAGKFVVAFINDITIRKSAEQEIRRLNDELEVIVEERTHQLKETLHELEASKEELTRALGKEIELNELKSRFVSLASHEFRTPLSTVLSSTYLIQQYHTTEEQSKRQKHIDRVISSVSTLTDILNDFLSVGKIEEGKITVKLATFNFKELVSRILDEIRNIQKPGQMIRYQHEGPELVLLDSTLLKHIILNLLSNAIKFSPEHSVIAVNSQLLGDQLTLSVKDQGIGIPQEDQQHLFERFFRATNVTNIQGTGLGLHIVAKYAELMNGCIHCESQENLGTDMKVTFTIPGDTEDPAED